MFDKIRNRIFVGDSSDVLRGMLTLFLGAGFARIVGLISIPILARIYTPENYGTLALYMSLVSVIAPMMTLRYVQAIPLPKSDAMAFNLFSVCFKLIVIFSIMLAAVLAIKGEAILNQLNMEELVPWRWLIVLGVIGTAIYELFNSWSTRKRQYKIIARTQVMQSMIGNCVKIGLGLLAFKSSGLLIGQFIMQSAGTTSFIKHSLEEFKFHFPKVKLGKEKLVAKYYQAFVWFRLPSQFLMLLSTQAPVFMIASLYDANVIGQYGLAKMAIMVPSGLIGQAVSKAYYAEIAVIGKSNYKKIKKITWDVQKKLALVGGPSMLLLSVFSPWLFETVFGQEWRLAGEYARVLSPYALLILISSPLIQVLNIVGSQFVYLIINIIRIIGLLLFFYLSKYIELNAYEFITAFSIFSVVYATFQLMVVFYYVNRASKMEVK